MEQVYTPNLKVPAVSGMCLQYVDDAGNAPNRTTTAKIAYNNEKKSGRLRTDNLPENVWVVVWMSFSKGTFTYPNGVTYKYSDLWHIGFARKNGNFVEIYDSEVGAGNRLPYLAIGEWEAWFSFYGAKYVGWSTHCDGREYAKERNQMQRTALNRLIKAMLNRDANDSDRKKYLNKDPNQVIIDIDDWARKNNRTYSQTIDAKNKEISELKKQSSSDSDKKLQQIKKIVEK